MTDYIRDIEDALKDGALMLLDRGTHTVYIPNKAALEIWNTRAPVRVKKLVWEGDGHWHSGDNEGWLEEAKTPFGTYYTIKFADSLGAGV